MIISINGNEGSGKSTVAQLLADKLGYKRYYIGGMRREAAARRGITLDEYNKLGETDHTTDTEVDYYAKELGEKEDNFVIEGRTMFHFIPHSFKVYISVSPEEGARRVVQSIQKEKTNRNETKYETIEQAVEGLEKRKRSDIIRYKKHYNIDIHDPNNYNFIIDSTSIPAEEVAQKIIDNLPKE